MHRFHRNILLVSSFLGFGMANFLAAAPIPLPGGGQVEKVDFERHVMGLFGRMGCNSGSCHGSFQGKNGFRLSLFGYDPEKDYRTLTRETLGRRVNQVEPERSLLLMKPTGQVSHGGGRRFGEDSWQYRILREWIVTGSSWSKGSGTVASLRVDPFEYRFKKRGEKGQLQVLAKFEDGSEENVTPFCDFRSNDDRVAEVTPFGQVMSVSSGDAALVISYRGNVIPVRALVPVDTPQGFVYPDVAEANFIDHSVFGKLKRLAIVPADLSSDSEFLRRVTIDTIGCLPTPAEARAFLDDKDPDKRVKKIDALLAHPMHAALWATKFCDITGNNIDQLENPREKYSKMWHDWFRKRLAENLPYDELVRGVLCATSRDGKEPRVWLEETKAIDNAAMKGFDAPYAERASLDLFWRRGGKAQVPLEQWGEKTAAAFLGIRLECAQCHKHPFDRWTQADYRAHANLFGQMKYSMSPEAKDLITEENKERKMAMTKGKKASLGPIREVFVDRNKPVAFVHPDTNARLPAKALGGPIIEIQPGVDARITLYEWLRSSDNPYFARAFANRVWGHYLGVGIVEPVDDFSLANPPSNPELLDSLARDFIEHKFDIRNLERTILLSRVYQLSSATNDSNRLDRRNYTHGYARRMPAEVVADVLNSALDVAENWGKTPEVPPNSRVIEVGPSRVTNPNLAYLFRIFGRSPRTLACDCEKSMEPALPQTLYLLTDTNVMTKLQQSRVVALLKTTKSDAEILDELFLATLTRYPNDAEKDTFASYQKGKNNRQAIFRDTLWALINTREFILNH